MYLQRERRSPVCAVSEAISRNCGMRTGLCEREGVASGRGGAGAVCLWRSCTSGVQCTAQLAAGGRCGARGRCGKRAVRAGHKGLTDGGNRRVGFCGALQLELVGARCAAPAALLRRESPFPSDAACADANERAARGSQRNGTGAGVRAGAAVAGRWQRCNNAAPSRRGVLAAGTGGFYVTLIIMPFVQLRLAALGSAAWAIEPLAGQPGQFTYRRAVRWWEPWWVFRGGRDFWWFVRGRLFGGEGKSIKSFQYVGQSAVGSKWLG